MTPDQATFDTLRSHAFAVAYKMLGSVSDAEDIVQNAWIRWQRAKDQDIRNPKAWLTTVVTRLGIDHLRAVKSRRETYIGPWLPDPLVDDDIVSPLAPEPQPTAEERMIRADDISTALLVVLEKLAPEERAAFLLHDAFDFSYPEISDILEKSQDACRQIVSRARKRVTDNKPRFDASAEEHRKLSHAFYAALSAGDAQAMVDLLSEDAVLHTDGGGKAIAARNLIYGPDRIMRFCLGIATKVTRELTLEMKRINGLPGFVAFENGAPFSTFSLAVKDGRIERIYMMRNPDKMHHLGAPGA